MKPEKARQILGAARPHGQDAADPRVAAARKALAHDPDALRAIEAQAERDRTRAEALQNTPVPEGLRDSLLREIGQTTDGGRTTATRRWPWIGVAAAVVLLASLALVRWQWLPRAEFAQTRDFREAMAVYIAKVPFQLDFTSQQLGAIRQWLGDASVPELPAIPEDLAERVPLGCKKIQWGEVTVSLVCFYDSIPEGRIVHLFVAPRSALSEEAVGEIEQTLVAQGFDTRGWRTDEYVCVLVPSSRDMRVSPLLDDPAFVRPA